MIKSIEETTKHEIVINKSRFICILIHVQDKEEVKE